MGAWLCGLKRSEDCCDCVAYSIPLSCSPVPPTMAAPASQALTFSGLPIPGLFGGPPGASSSGGAWSQQLCAVTPDASSTTPKQPTVDLDDEEDLEVIMVPRAEQPGPPAIPAPVAACAATRDKGSFCLQVALWAGSAHRQRLPHFGAQWHGMQDLP